MSAHYFVVAFGSKAGALDDDAAVVRSRQLRRFVELVIDKCCPNPPEDMLVSVAPGGIMIAFRDAQIDPARRTIECAKQVLLLGGFADLGLCAVVVGGVLEPVCRSWMSNNFEGPAATIAARILAKLNPGALALHLSGGSALDIVDLWPETAVFSKCVLAGKHVGESFWVHVDDTALLSEVAIDQQENGARTEVSTWEAMTEGLDAASKPRIVLAHGRDVPDELVRSLLGKLRAKGFEVLDPATDAPTFEYSRQLQACMSGAVRVIYLAHDNETLKRGWMGYCHEQAQLAGNDWRVIKLAEVREET